MGDIHHLETELAAQMSLYIVLSDVQDNNKQQASRLDTVVDGEKSVGGEIDA